LAQHTVGGSATDALQQLIATWLLKSSRQFLVTVDESVTGCDGSLRAFFRRFFVVILPAWRHNWAAPSAAHFVDSPAAQSVF
jgi:hypothetical protein